MDEKSSGLVIALGGKPKGKPEESGKSMTGSSAKKALWKALKGDDFEAFSEAFDLVCDERDDSYAGEEPESDDD